MSGADRKGGSGVEADHPLWPSMVIRQDPGSAESRAVGLAATLIGLASRPAKIEDLPAFTEALRLGALPVGSVEFVRRAMDLAGLCEPPSIGYPDELHSMLGRSVELSSAALSLAPGPARFVKPVSVKAFTGFVFDPSVSDLDMDEYASEQLAALRSLPPGSLVWTAPVVEFVAEWRAYMLGSKVLGIARYDPEGPEDAVEPDAAWIEMSARPWLDKKNAPAACAVDVGRLADGSLALVEVNDAWALGLYGKSIDPKSYLLMLCARWSQILADPSLREGVNAQSRPRAPRV